MQLAFEGNAISGDQRLLLTGTGTDMEDGSLTGASLSWYSDRDGKLGTGEELNVAADDLSEGRHVFWLEAVDSQGLSNIVTKTLETTGGRKFATAAMGKHQTRQIQTMVLLPLPKSKSTATLPTKHQNCVSTADFLWQ